MKFVSLNFGTEEARESLIVLALGSSQDGSMVESIVVREVDVLGARGGDYTHRVYQSTNTPKTYHLSEGLIKEAILEQSRKAGRKINVAVEQRSLLTALGDEKFFWMFSITYLDGNDALGNGKPYDLDTTSQIIESIPNNPDYV